MSAFRQAKPAVVLLHSTQWSRVVNPWQTPTWLTDARRAISRLADLETGWDGGNSPAPRSESISTACLILDQLDAYAELPPPSVAPIVGGGINVEWRVGSRDLDIEILPDGMVEFLKSERNDGKFDVTAMEDGQINCENPREVKKLAKWLLGC